MESPMNVCITIYKVQFLFSHVFKKVTGTFYSLRAVTYFKKVPAPFLFYFFHPERLCWVGKLLLFLLRQTHTKL